MHLLSRTSLGPFLVCTLVLVCQFVVVWSKSTASTEVRVVNRLDLQMCQPEVAYEAYLEALEGNRRYQINDQVQAVNLKEVFQVSLASLLAAKILAPPRLVELIHGANSGLRLSKVDQQLIMGYSYCAQRTYDVRK